MAVVSTELVSTIGGSQFRVPVKFDSSKCKVTIEKLVTFERGGTFDGGHADSAFAAMTLRVLRAVRRYWDNKFELVVTPTGELPCPCTRISIEVRLKQAPGGYPVTLVGGGQGASGSGTDGAEIQEHDRPGASTEAETSTYAHEAGHFALGLPDEYAGNNAGSPVHNDGSIMGNYHDPLQPKPPEPKERQFEPVRAWVQSLLPPTCVVTLRKVGH
jgi:hypothetical protein